MYKNFGARVCVNYGGDQQPSGVADQQPDGEAGQQPGGVDDWQHGDNTVN